MTTKKRLEVIMVPSRIKISPKETLCLKEEGPGDLFLVPFPVLFKTDYVFEWTRVLQDYITDNQKFIVRHPDLDIGVQCSREGYFRTNSLFIISAYPSKRVRITDTRIKQNDLEFVDWATFMEINPSYDRYLEESFQEKIKQLRKLEFTFRFRDLIDDAQAVELPPLFPFNESAVGPLVDLIASQLNPFIEEKEIKEALILILEEKNIEMRLDMAITIYEHCLKISGGLEVVFEPGKTGEPTEHIPTREELINRRIFELGLARQLSDMETGEHQNKEPSAQNDLDASQNRENLIKERILEKRGDGDACGSSA